MKILIATGIYPPDIGGPAQYAAELERVWKSEGHDVVVKYFSFEKKLPTGIRHVVFFIKSIRAVKRADYILVLDTWSVALPTALLCKILNKKFIVRTGGDFLWESYVERTRRKILFRDFYKTEISNFTAKERTIFRLTKWILFRASKIVFSTSWQRDVWQTPYKVDLSKTVIIENYFGQKEKYNYQYGKNKIFLGSVRNLVWKNTDLLTKIFSKDLIKSAGAVLDLNISSREKFLDSMRNCYAVILASLGDISPNMIIDAITLNKPFIVTKEIGIADRIKDVAVFVDPLDEKEIEEKVVWLLNEDNYNNHLTKFASFSFTHNWEQISRELLTLKS